MSNLIIENYKLITWHALVVVLAWRLWAYGGNTASPSAVNIGGVDFDLFSIGIFVILMALIVLGIAMFRKHLCTLSFCAFVGIFFLLQFGFTPLNLLGVAILVALGFYSRLNILNEIQQRNKINIRKILQAGLWPLVLGMFILISFVAYTSPAAKEIENNRKLPSQSEVFIRQIIEKTVASGESQGMANQISRQVLNEFNSFLKPYFKYAPPLLAFGLFLILWSLSWFFVWFSVLIGMALFWILKKAGIIRIQEEEAKAETLIV